MAYSQKIWKDRVSENPIRRTLTPIDGSTPMTVDVSRTEGTVLEEGDAFSAENMNDLERRIAEGIGAGDVLIAGIESTAIASKAYVKGQYLIYNSLLYRVTAAIAKNASLVPNTNITQVKLADEVYSIGTRTSTLENEFTANSKRIYFDYKNGKYGYNTSSSRGADTFFPFKGEPETIIYQTSAPPYPTGSTTVELGETYAAVMSGNGLYSPSTYVEYDGEKHYYPAGPAGWDTVGGVIYFTPTQSTTVSWSSSNGTGQSGNKAAFALIKCS